MKDLRIVFMGTPDFAVAILDALIEANHNIVGVITAPDKPAGRGRKINQSAVKQYAVKKGLTILQPTNLKDPDFILQLKNLQANLQVVVAFRMLPKQVWSLPELGTFNLHASLLPDYRGAAPINWSIINGDIKTGVTTFFINEDIDTGAIIKQESVSIEADMNAGVLHDKLMVLGSKVVLDTVRMIQKGNACPADQKDGTYRPAPKLNKLNCRIPWNLSKQEVYNHIRGLNPFPGAWTLLENGDHKIELKIYDSLMIDEPHTLKTGTLVVSKKNLRVAVADGFIEIKDLKMAGKRKMDAISLLNGYEFKSGCKFI